MLHIKLPKGKVADALVKLAQWHEMMDRSAKEDYGRQLEVWRKDLAQARQEGREVGYLPHQCDRSHQIKAQDFFHMAGACKHSTGDVYVSGELWQAIRGHYHA